MRQPASDARGPVAAVGVGALLTLGVIAGLVADPPIERSAAWYWGTHVVEAPAPAQRGLPLIAVSIDIEGELIGIPNHLEWYGYLGREAAPGLQPDYAGNDTFHYYANPERIQLMQAEGIRPWWLGRMHEAVRPEHFPHEWSGAPALWRSMTSERADGIPVVVMRADPRAYPPEVREEFVRDGFVAFAATDTDFGCTVGYEMVRDEPRVRNKPEYPVLLDPCHDSMYDPRRVERFALP